MAVNSQAKVVLLSQDYQEAKRMQYTENGKRGHNTLTPASLDIKNNLYMYTHTYVNMGEKGRKAYTDLRSYLVVKV